MKPRPWQIVVDALIAVGLLAISLAAARLAGGWSGPGEWGGPGGGWGEGGLLPEARPADALAFVLLIVAILPVAVRRFWPIPVAAVTVVATAAYLALGYSYGPVLAAFAIVIYTLARAVRTAVAASVAAGALVLLSVHVFTSAQSLSGVIGLAPASAWVVVPFSIGLTRRLVRQGRLRERADDERRALDEERLRIAHEVHDVVGHGLAAIRLQADVARHIDDPAQARAALDAISLASAEALTELRSTLAGLTPDDRGPTPGLATIPELCARIHAAGIDVTLDVSGAARALPPAADVAAYRIVQESLTNVVKHSAERRATVQVMYTDAAVELRVVNPHHGPGDVSGFGIDGMRRRAESVHGTLSAGGADGRFVVEATLPAP